MPVRITAMLTKPGGVSPAVHRAFPGFHTVSVRVQENEFITL